MLDGASACPPEDVGEVPGYYEFSKALKDPDHEEYESLVEWAGENYDSEKFDSDEVNCELMKYRHWSRDRYRQWTDI